MLILKKSDIPSSEITPKRDYMNRRSFMAAAAAGVAAVAGECALRGVLQPPHVKAAEKLNTIKSPLSTTGVTPTSFEDITHYNNFYEFGPDKGDPAKNSGSLHTRPWSIKVEGLVAKPQTFDIDTLLKLRPMEERIYRFRCVEAWSMVIPWAGYSLSEFIKQCQPLSTAKYVQFISLADSKQEPLPWSAGIQWPYQEGLRMDEAMHPLTLLTFGLYGQELPNQDGAPVRIIVPWKYGFKSAKSIVKIKFVKDQPSTTWNEMAANEYGFYSNVNPNVDHPRWSQKRERVIGAPIFRQLQPTLMFNGYGDQVASLYNGMDLRKNY
ncbi:MAG TPA: protein-methionine-sulfoxide reductase catalytic subunit MsrP [Acidobacteriaceae bacterium]|nr:protein-methionine-sulfoxide reductase catalytic subunit MsrP [Acidobacteriaceae bacterium]